MSTASDFQSSFLTNINNLDDVRGSIKDMKYAFVYLKSDKESFHILIRDGTDYHICTIHISEYNTHLVTLGLSRKTSPDVYFKHLKDTIAIGNNFWLKESQTLLSIFHGIELRYTMDACSLLIGEQMLHDLELIAKIKRQMKEQHEKELEELRSKLNKIEVSEKLPISKHDEKEEQKIKINSSFLYPNRRKHAIGKGIKIL